MHSSSCTSAGRPCLSIHLEESVSATRIVTLNRNRRRLRASARDGHIPSVPHPWGWRNFAIYFAQRNRRAAAAFDSPERGEAGARAAAPRPERLRLARAHRGAFVPGTSTGTASRDPTPRWRDTAFNPQGADRSLRQGAPRRVRFPSALTSSPRAALADRGPHLRTRRTTWPRCRGAWSSTDAFDCRGVPHPDHPPEDLIIYEVHIRGLTRHPSSGVGSPALSFWARREDSLPQGSGLNVVEAASGARHGDGAVAGHARDCATTGATTPSPTSPRTSASPFGREPACQVREFKPCPRAAPAGIEVILDVFYNTAARAATWGRCCRCAASTTRCTTACTTADASYEDFTGCGIPST